MTQRRMKPPKTRAPSQSQGEAPRSEEPAEETTDETAAETTETDEAEGMSDKAEGTEVEIGTEFTDEETGDVITIVSAVAATTHGVLRSRRQPR